MLGAVASTSPWVIDWPCPEIAGSLREARRECPLFNLRLVRGIGPVTESRLRKQGVSTVADLAVHRRFSSDARDLLAALERRDLTDLRSRGAADSELLWLCPDRGLLFVDVETTGLYWTQPLFLVGVLRAEPRGQPTLRQFVARDLDEEEAVLDCFAREVEDKPVLVTFNGKAFDLPFIRARMSYFGRTMDKLEPHVDLLGHARKKLRRTLSDLPDCRLVTLEERVLRRQRSDDIPSWMVPEIYRRYLVERDPAVLGPVIEHNRLDLLAMAGLFCVLLAGQEAEAARSAPERGEEAET